MKAHSSFRPEIQGLRAVAVLAVLAFHIWPTAVSGGYVGVDVFFVISGYLITGLLLKEYEATGTISVGHFYERRIRRLLPAATAVLLVAAAGVALLPVTRWADTARDIAASALYGQNWWLAHQAVDYLASENAPSPVQHFWSLSVEEQYYIVWPLLVLAATHLTRWTARHPRRAFSAFVLVIGAASLAYSVYLTPRNPGLAYFATTTRAWELALGGSLAVFRGWQSWPQRLRLTASCLGIVMIGVPIFAYTTATPFPGYTALLPTVGAALVIAGGCMPYRFGPASLLSSWPAQVVGDLSYSLYLWHWPVIIFYKAKYGDDISALGAAVILVASLGLALLSKRWIEDRYRVAPEGPRRITGSAWVLASFCITLSVLSSIGVRALAKHPPAPPMLAGEDIEANYPGARALTEHVQPADPNAPYLPRPVDAKTDEPEAYTDHCITSGAGDGISECRYGSDDPTAPLMIVVGDSHAVHWLPPLRIIAEQRHWRMRTIVRSACAFADIKPEDFEDDQTRLCASWNQKAIRKIAADRPDVIVVSQSIYTLGHMVKGSIKKSRTALISAMLDAWKHAAGQTAIVVAIKDTPRPGRNIPDCLSASGATMAKCARSRKTALQHWDPLVVAASRMAQARLINLDDAFCGKKRCDPVVGNVLIWRDAHHMTARFAKTLAPALAEQLVPIVVSGGTKKGGPSTRIALSPEVRMGPEAQPIYDRVVKSKSGIYFRRQIYGLEEGTLEHARAVADAGLENAGYNKGHYNAVAGGLLARFSGAGLPSAVVKITEPPARLKATRAKLRFVIYVSWRENT